MLLKHIRLPGLSRYSEVAQLQQRLVNRLLAHKASPATVVAPDPVVLTCEFQPVYTCGRREIKALSAEHIEYLKADGKAEFYEALRGGQTTFHGPGQLVAYPIIDLRRHGLTPRCYVNMLEGSVINTLARWGIDGQRTENPGVWTDDDHKICAVGVHLRRNVTSHGIGLNISTDLGWFERIVACGLEGKSSTSFAEQGVEDTNVEEVSQAFVEELADSLPDENITGTEAIMVGVSELLLSPTWLH